MPTINRICGKDKDPSTDFYPSDCEFGNHTSSCSNEISCVATNLKMRSFRSFEENEQPAASENVISPGDRKVEMFSSFLMKIPQPLLQSFRTLTLESSKITFARSIFSFLAVLYANLKKAPFTVQATQPPINYDYSK
jgi:hypothetical protein